MGKIRYNHHILKIKMVGDKFIFLKSIINACLGHGGGGSTAAVKGRFGFLGHFLSHLAAGPVAPLTCNSLAAAWDWSRRILVSV
jgi:hypothetical protein